MELSVPEDEGDVLPGRVHSRRAHLANERTFLAWIRTSIGIMAFGFVVEKFALFVRCMSIFLMQAEGQAQQEAISSSARHSLEQPHGYSSLFGSCLVGLGAFMGILAFVRFKRVEKQIDTDTYQASLMSLSGNGRKSLAFRRRL